MRTLETILAETADNWSEDDYKVIAQAQATLGRQKVKALRDKLSNPAPEEQIVS